MLDAWGDHPAVRQTLAEAVGRARRGHRRADPRRPEGALDLTTNTQPVMLTAAIACYRAWRAEGGAEPAAVAGHSLGEYSALVAAGALTLADALPLVRFRAQAMQEAVPVGAGAMAAILGLDAAVVAAVCADGGGRDRRGRRTGQLQRPQADRHRRQQGRRRPRLRDAARPPGAKRALLLAVSAPFHSSLMQPAAEACASGWRAVRDPRAAHPGGQQHRRRRAERPRRHPRRAVPPGQRPGALGRGGAGAARPRPDARARVRPGQGAVGPGQAHRRRAWSR